MLNLGHKTRFRSYGLKHDARAHWCQMMLEPNDVKCVPKLIGSKHPPDTRAYTWCLNPRASGVVLEPMGVMWARWARGTKQGESSAGSQMRGVGKTELGSGPKFSKKSQGAKVRSSHNPEPKLVSKSFSKFGSS